jgi:predicted TIM-barrel fold metal-dependent hydrolase
MPMSVQPAIDADGHIYELPEEIRPYLDSKWRSRGTAFWPQAQPWDTRIGGAIAPPRDYKRGISAKQQVDIWHGILDDYTIERAVLFPTGAGGIDKLQERDFARAVMRATNDHFSADYQTDRLFPVGTLIVREPETAAREIERGARELGLKAFVILPDGRPAALGDPIYDPVYEAAQACDVALTIHASRVFSHEWGGDKLQTFSEVHSYAFIAGILANFTSVLCQGLTIRFPKLKMAFLEVGVTWLPYYLDRLDEHWEKRAEQDMPLLPGKPSEVFRDSNLKVSLEGKETLLRETIDFVGVEHLIYATDLPHWDGEFPKNLESLRDTDILNAAEKKAILRDNAAALYGF